MATSTAYTTTPTIVAGTGGSAGGAPTMLDYQLLLGEIKSTIDKNDSLFKQIQQSNYPNAGSYTSDLLNYKIDNQITDLTQTRNQIWDFLTKKYTENTNLRTYYFDELRKADEHINDLQSQKNDIIELININKNNSSTSSESIKQQKYYFSKMEYYLFLYKALVFIQIIILAIITVCIIGIINRNTCLVMVIIVLIAAASFVAYYVFMVNIGRSMFSWGKFEHNNTPLGTNQVCIKASPISADDKEKQSADQAVSAIVSQSKPTRTS